MKSKSFTALAAISVILLAAMTILAWQSGQKGYQSLLLAAPNNLSSRGLTPQRVEELSSDEFLTTYEMLSSGTAEAANSRYTVTIVATNSVYPHVTGQQMLEGGFFTKPMWDGAQKYLVLNRTAAFEIFGSTNITGRTLRIGADTWTVTGVMDDGSDEDSVLYVPSSVMSGQIGSLLVLMNEYGEIYAMDVLGTSGVRDTDYDFVNLSKVSGGFAERITVALLTAACLIILCAAKRGVLSLRKTHFAFKEELQQLYPRELLIKRKGEVIKACAVILFLLGGLVTVMYALLRILATCLAWRDVSLPARYMGADFADMTAWLYDYHDIGVGLFTVFLIAAALAAIVQLTAKR